MREPSDYDPADGPRAPSDVYGCYGEPDHEHNGLCVLDEPDTRPLYVNVYRLDRHYGGPEEGGWYYDSGEPLAAIPADDDAHAERLRAEYEAKYEDHGHRYSFGPRERDYKVVIERGWPEAWPQQRPHYE